jgi:hypothetical protein
MANAHIHSASSVRRFGGEINDYIAIHQKMDCSKAYISHNGHRALTHHTFWIHEVMIPIFGYTIKISNGRDICVKDICEQHILEDFGMKYIPTAQDYIENIENKDWMNGGSIDFPSSFKKLINNKKSKRISLD